MVQKSYLDNRKQFVTYNGVSSEIKSIKCGVPQGSILGPLIFLIYINDLANVCESSLSFLFAVDTNVFNHGHDLSLFQHCKNQELAGISKWLKVYTLSLNIKKTHFMIFTRKKLQKKITLCIDNQPIHQAESSKFLGLYIDEKLKWKLHISYLAGKIARRVGIILKAGKYFTNDCMVQLYDAFIVPYLM